MYTKIRIRPSPSQQALLKNFHDIKKGRKNREKTNREKWSFSGHSGKLFKSQVGFGKPVIFLRKLVSKQVVKNLPFMDP